MITLLFVPETTKFSLTEKAAQTLKLLTNPTFLLTIYTHDVLEAGKEKCEVISTKLPSALYNIYNVYYLY